VQSSAPSADPGDPINSLIGARVRAIRLDEGLTLNALAAKSNVSRAMLSLIERGETSPTATLLDKVATALNVSLAALFEDTSAQPSPVSRRNDHASWRDPETGYVRRNISPANHPSSIQIVEVTLPASARIAYDNGPRDFRIHQQIWIRKGRVEITVGDVTHHLGSDDCLAMELGAPTVFCNRTRVDARYIVVLSTERPHRRKT